MKSVPLQTITAYKFKIKKLKTKDDEGNVIEEHDLPIGSGKNENVLNFTFLLRTFFEQIKVKPVSSKFYNKLLRIDNYDNTEVHLGMNREHCQTAAGYYGRLLKIVNVKNMKDTKTVNPNEAITANYNVYFYVKENSIENVCVFHRCGRGGCKTIFFEFFNQYLKSLGLKIDLRAQLSEEMVQRVKRGRLLEMNLIKTSKYRKKSSDLADFANDKEEAITKRRDYELKINLRSRKRGEKIENWYETYVLNQEKVKEMFEFIPNDFEFDEMSYLLEFDNQQKTFMASELQNLMCEYNVTTKLKYDMNGYPLNESLSSVVDDYVKGII